MPQLAALDQLIQFLGSKAKDLLLTDPGDIAPFLMDCTRNWRGHSIAVALPRNSADVVAIVQAAANADLAIVPQGGNTGLTGGSSCGAERQSIVVSLQRMTAIRNLEPGTPAVIVEAGCVLADLQTMLATEGLHIPLGLGSEGSATIGGLVSTNAGGIRALRHGVMRAQVLGLEVVLPDGRVWDGLRTVLKNNMGYDLKQLFIGAEGTLGIITAVALRADSVWQHVETALVGVSSPSSALELLHRVRDAMGDVVVACELIQHLGMELGVATLDDISMPFAAPQPWYVLIETATVGNRVSLRDELETSLGAMLGDGLVHDAVIAQSTAQRRKLWRLRESVIDGKRQGGMAVNFDVAIPPGKVAHFIEESSRRAVEIAPSCRSLAFGHIGDGNVHFSIHQSANDSELPTNDLTQAIHALALDLGGSICAEHGVGRKMRDIVAEAVGPVELDLFETIKFALDPKGLFNPGAMVGSEDQCRN